MSIWTIQLHRPHGCRFPSRKKTSVLCFNAASYQKTHPKKQARGKADADVALVSQHVLGVFDGVSEVEKYGIDASEFPRDLVDAVAELAASQFTQKDAPRADPVTMLQEAYESTDSLGSTTALLACMDNHTVMDGAVSPSLNVLTLGDCQMLVLRRGAGRLQPVFETEMQRPDGGPPFQLMRVDERIDPWFEESMAVQTIERDSAVHKVPVHEGDIVVMGSDGVFDNLFAHEIISLCEGAMQSCSAGRLQMPLLEEIANAIVQAALTRTTPGASPTPCGRGGKADDTCCVVGEVVEWTE